jgi:ElaB/YqjD/DUF883 family membrane-anchored ribosome-binding protein/uncharacterized protein YfkK (UPF0435 family)/ribosomal protein S15P/S13E
MFETILNPCLLPMAQVTLAQENLNPEAASVLFSGPKFAIALVAGLVMAFAFQLLLTNLSVAVGIPILASDSDLVDDDDDNDETIGGKISRTESKIGLWALLTSSIALFAACFLAVKLSLIESALLGTIIGIVIWSAFFTVLMWLGSSAVGSLIGSLLSTATSGLQGIMGAATGAIGANIAKNQAISTAEDITAAVRQELTAGIDPDRINETLKNSLSSLSIPQLNPQEIRSQFDRLLGDIDLDSIGDRDFLKNVNRQTFIDLIGNRTNFSKQDITSIADQLEGAWNQVVNRQNPTEQIINLIQKASPEELNTDKLSERIQQLVAVGGNGNGKKTNGVMREAVRAALPAVIEKVDFSNVDIDKIAKQLQQLQGKVKDIDVDKITHQLEELKDKAADGVSDLFPQLSSSSIRSDIDDYILNALPWQFYHANLVDEFREVIYDSHANPSTVKKQLEELNKEYFAYMLKRRGDLNNSRVGKIAKDMDRIRTEVLEIVRQEAGKSQSQDLRQRLENYLRSTGKEELNPDAIERDLSNLLEDPDASWEDLQNRFSGLDRDTLVQLLAQREDFSEEEANKVISQFENIRETILNRVKETQEQVQIKAQELRNRVEEYLRNTNKEELNPDAIEREFQTLFEDPQAGFKALRDRISQFDRDTLVQLLSQREDIDEEQVNQIISRIENVRNRVLQAPKQAANAAQQSYEQTINSIAQYLRDTQIEELDPAGIQQDITKLLEDPKEGASALGERLSHVDRETLVKLLTQRGDLSEEQVNQSIDRIEEAIQNIVQAPRRLADRTTKGAIEFETQIENYLRSTDKEELNPDAIKRDLQLLLQSPRLGAMNLGDRAKRFNRETLVALLAQREDVSQEEAEQTVDRIISVRDSIEEQFNKVQQTVQSSVDRVFGGVRDYLNSLERPELNYENIEGDFKTLFDDPKAGFEALRDRLSQFDRETLVAVLSSREDISEEQANRIVDRIEHTRDRVLGQAQRIQQETKKRLKKIKEEAKQQAIDARKAVSDAAWWLFSASLTSLLASAIAGYLAVI